VLGGGEDDPVAAVQRLELRRFGDRRFEAGGRRQALRDRHRADHGRQPGRAVDRHRADLADRDAGADRGRAPADRRLDRRLVLGASKTSPAPRPETASRSDSAAWSCTRPATATIRWPGRGSRWSIRRSSTASPARGTSAWPSRTRARGGRLCVEGVPQQRRRRDLVGRRRPPGGGPDQDPQRPGAGLRGRRERLLRGRPGRRDLALTRPGAQLGRPPTAAETGRLQPRRLPGPGGLRGSRGRRGTAAAP
jgi:hypothetical protein